MKGTFKKILAMALAMTMAAGVLTGCGGKDPVADTTASGETVQPEVKQQVQQVLPAHLRMQSVVIRVRM